MNLRIAIISLSAVVLCAAGVVLWQMATAGVEDVLIVESTPPRIFHDISKNGPDTEDLGAKVEAASGQSSVGAASQSLSAAAGSAAAASRKIEAEAAALATAIALQKAGAGARAETPKTEDITLASATAAHDPVNNPSLKDLRDRMASTAPDSESDPRNRPEDDPERSPEEVAERPALISFSATLQTVYGEPVPGIAIFMTTAASSEFPFTAVARQTDALQATAGTSKLIADSNPMGKLFFELAPGPDVVSLFAVLGDYTRLLFNGPVLAESAWRDQVIVLEDFPVDGAKVIGMVLDCWGHPLPGAAITTSPISSFADHLGKLGQKGYVFALSGKDGYYVLNIIDKAGASTLHCVATGASALTLSLPQIDTGAELKGYNFQFVEAGPPPGVWKMRFVNAAGAVLPSLSLGSKPFASVGEALSSGAVVFSDSQGELVWSRLEPGVATALYVYHEKLGVSKLDEHSFEAGEVYAASYTLDVTDDKPGEIGFRLQDAGGVDLKKGWISTNGARTEKEVQSWLASGGSAAPVSPGKTTWLKNIRPWTLIDYFYSDGEKLDINLGNYELKSGEKRDVGLIRLKEVYIQKAELGGMVINDVGTPIPDLTILAHYGSGEAAGEAATDDSGFFKLKDLSQNRTLTLSARGRGGEVQILKRNYILEQPFVGGEVFIWVSAKPFKILVKDSGGRPVEKASVSLIAGEIRERDVSDAKGETEFAGLNTNATYTLQVSHSFYDFHERRDFKPDFSSGSLEVTLVPRVGVRVRLLGPDWETENLNVRAWVGERSGGLIAPDRMPGNEYGEELDLGELLFLTPPKREFFIYVGNMGSPWGDQIYGPFPAAAAQQILELPLERVEPTVFKLGGKDKIDLSMEVLRLIEPGPLQCQIFSYQFYGDNRAYMVSLGKGSYLIRAGSSSHGRFEKQVKLDGSAQTIVLDPRHSEKSGSWGGFVKGYLVSDRFADIRDEKNDHNNYQSYGFNKDWLSHLEGTESSFRAVHMGEHESPDGGTPITWRNAQANSNGTLDFVKYLSPTDYSVAYAQFRVHADSERKVVMGLSSDDSIKAWVNGSLVLSQYLPRPIFHREEHMLIPITLQPGENQFNFKVTNSWGQWALRIRLLEGDTPITHLRTEPDFGYTDVEVSEESADKVPTP